MPNPTTPEAVIRSIFAATDAKDTDAKLELVTDDVSLVFGSAEAIHGKNAFAEASDTFNDSLREVRHEITGLWVVSDGGEDLVLCQLQVHYTRLDGKALTLPCFNVFRVDDGLISDYRIYMDIGPVYA